MSAGKKRVLVVVLVVVVVLSALGFVVGFVVEAQHRSRMPQIDGQKIADDAAIFSGKTQRDTHQKQMDR